MKTILTRLLILSLACCSSAFAKDKYSDVEIKTIPAAGNVYMLTGSGGNLGVSVGTDGVFLVDDQFAPLTEKIQAAIAKLSGQPLRFMLNTHWHPDHTGGNENLGDAGVTLVAHDNVRKRLSVDSFIEMFQMNAPALPGKGLPIVTFDETITFHMNDDEIRAWHVENAHTDGDSIVHFTQANVLHMGDTYFAGMYPFIDTSSGGSVDGCIRALDQALAIADDSTVIIPGHGPLSNRRELLGYRNMLQAVSWRIRGLINERATLAEVQEARPTARFDDAYGGGFIDREKFIAMLYSELKR